MTMNTSTWPREMFKNPIVSLASRAAPPYLIRESCRAKNFNVKLNHTKTAKKSGYATQASLQQRSMETNDARQG